MIGLTRRGLLKGTSAAGAALGLHRVVPPSAATPAGMANTGGSAVAATPAGYLDGPVDVRWLDGGKPAELTGVTWGMSWPQGQLPVDQVFSLQTATGESIAAQSWPTARWGDGSLKWCAIAAGPHEPASGYRIAPGQPAAPATALVVHPGESTIEIDTGVIVVRLDRAGENLIRSIVRGGREIARNGRLVLLRADAPIDGDEGVLARTAFVSRIQTVEVEQSGPVRAVVRIDGRHGTRGPQGGGREWMPFRVRLYLYAGGEAIRMVHTSIFDGDPDRDAICGLGVRFDVPMADPPYNRHVRFAGQGDGVFAEAVQGLTGLRRDPGAEVRAAQIAGRAVPAVSGWDTRVSSRLPHIPAWGDYSVRQLTADSFQVRKRTAAGRGWVDAASGGRAGGLAYLGGPSGGLALGLRNFWQLHPTQLDLRDATRDTAQATVWLYSPDATPMDLRFYHDGMGQDTYAKQREGLEITYEDYEPGFGTPVGVARTSELMIWALPGTPDPDRFARLAQTLANPPLLVVSPQRLHATGVFGDWAPVDRSTPQKAKIEDHLDFLFEFHQGQVEQRSWYGYWNYGDVMHTYDPNRHVWSYDVGGYAWDNSELSTDLWLWYQYLRTASADVFRFAEAMTRHTGEVDVYHLGRFAGLGTRHGVHHWGDSAKQLRISTAANRRFYYYLTADERVGDLLHELINADRTFLTLDPQRKVRTNEYHPQPHALAVGLGTDWGSLAAAWLTEIERGGDPAARTKLLNGMRTIGAQTNGFVEGEARYDPDTGSFATAATPQVNVSHLSAVFGLVEVCSELIAEFDVPEFTRQWLRYCRFFNATEAEQIAEFGASFGPLNLHQGHSRLTAYVAARTGDAALAARAWKEFFDGRDGYGPTASWCTYKVEGSRTLAPVDEATFVSSNATAQYALAAIQCLALVGDHLPA